MYTSYFNWGDKSLSNYKNVKFFKAVQIFTKLLNCFCIIFSFNFYLYIHNITAFKTNCCISASFSLYHNSYWCLLYDSVKYKI